jgi:hypothetical protein
MDKYSKIILTIILFLLIAILLKPGFVSELKANSGIIDVNIEQINGRYISRGIPVLIIE